MKTVDIVVGQEYGHKPWKGAREERVKVLRTGVPLKSRSYSSSKTTKSGVTVEFLDKDNRTETVPTREITETWAEIAERRKRQAEYQAAIARDAIEGRAKRAATAQAIVMLLDEIGGEDVWPLDEHGIYTGRSDYIDKYDIADEAATAGWHVIEDQVFASPRVVTRYPGVFIYWQTGSQISLTAEQILALADLGYEDPECQCHRDDS